MIGAKVNVVGNWGAEFAKQVNQQVKVELARATEDGAQAASRASLPRKRTGHMAHMEILTVRPTPTGWEGGFRSKAYYAGWQSRGTLGSFKGKPSAATLARRASPSGQARAAKTAGRHGITPLKFLEKGRAEARKSLIARLNRL